MKRYLLDTNVISETRKPKPHGAVIAWLGDTREEQLFVAAVTIGELQTGIERTRRQGPAKAQQIEEWLDQLSGKYQILPMDDVCFREWARLMSGRPGEMLEDAMIAATARVHGLVVATRNVRHFSHLQVELFDPFLSH